MKFKKLYDFIEEHVGLEVEFTYINNTSVLYLQIDGVDDNDCIVYKNSNSPGTYTTYINGDVTFSEIRYGLMKWNYEDIDKWDSNNHEKCEVKKELDNKCTCDLHTVIMVTGCKCGGK